MLSVLLTAGVLQALTAISVLMVASVLFASCARRRRRGHIEIVPIMEEISWREFEKAKEEYYLKKKVVDYLNPPEIDPPEEVKEPVTETKKETEEEDPTKTTTRQHTQLLHTEDEEKPDARIVSKVSKVSESRQKTETQDESQETEERKIEAVPKKPSSVVPKKRQSMNENRKPMLRTPGSKAPAKAVGVIGVPEAADPPKKKKSSGQELSLDQTVSESAMASVEHQLSELPSEDRALVAEVLKGQIRTENILDVVMVKGSMVQGVKSEKEDKDNYFDF